MMMHISVAIASYNGEKYIRDQVMSILLQIDKHDEIIISDDGSTDGTIDIIKNLQQIYPQIHLTEGPRQGIVRNFMNAIDQCSKEIVFLCDQDDIWCEEKVEKVKRCFSENPSIDVVLHNAVLFSAEKVSDTRLLNYKQGFFFNWLKSSYWGCCMAAKRNFLREYFDKKSTGIAHDQIIGLIAEKNKTAKYLDENLIYHRIHAHNKTKKLNLQDKILFRVKVYQDYSRYYHKRM